MTLQLSCWEWVVLMEEGILAEQGKAPGGQPVCIQPQTCLQTRQQFRFNQKSGPYSRFLRAPWTAREINPVNPKENQP